MVSESIKRYRTADATVTVMSGGAPLANAQVTVAQTNHKFLFGNIGFAFIPFVNGEAPAGPGGTDASVGEPTIENMQQLADLWFGLFNAATLPFYWGRFEPERGKPDTARILKTARWFQDHGVVVKGHPLAWHTVCADWLLPLSNDEIIKVQRDRITREMTDFAGAIDMWDVINEVVIMPIFDKYDNGITRITRDSLGRIGMIRMVFDAARAANPKATLLLNDFDMSAAYECLIEGVLEAGIKIDVLGLQSHMHQGYWGEEKTNRIVERFARFGLPIHFTETTLLSGHIMPPEIEDLNDYQIPDWPTTPEGEERQADEIVRHYTTLMAQPSVHALTYWGISDGGWLGAPGGFVRKDGTPKPAYHALKKLVKGEWWLAPTTMTTDAEGRFRFNGFLGDYEVTAGGDRAAFKLDAAGAAEVKVRLGK
jgi:endo-1,4-beta-xylanase